MIHAAAAIFISSLVYAGNEVIRDFRLRSCAGELCVLVESDEARRTPIDAAYAFRTARVTLLKKGRVTKILRGPSGYFDPDLGYLVLHDRGLINLISGRVTLISAR